MLCLLTHPFPRAFSAGFLPAAAAASVLVGASAPAPAAAEGFRASRTATIEEVNTVRVNLRGSSGLRLAANGNSVRWESYSDADDQVWRMQQLGTGSTFRLQNVRSNRWLRADGAGGWRPGSNVTTTAWRNWNSQKWEIAYAGNGRVRAKPVGVGYWLRSANLNNNANAQLGSSGSWEGRDVKVQSVENVDSPSITTVTNGDLFVYLKRNRLLDGGGSIGKVYRSTDNGNTWSYRGSPGSMYGPTLYGRGNTLYLIYGSGDGVYLKKSTDAAASWTTSKVVTLSGQSLESGGGAPVLFANNRIHYSFMDRGGPSGWPTQFRLRVASCPTNKNSTDAKNWTVTGPAAFPSNPAVSGTRGGWLEGNPVKLANGRVGLIARVDHTSNGNVVAALELSSDAKSLAFTNRSNARSDQTGFFTGSWAGSSKFHIRYDSGSKRWWVLCNPYHGTPSINTRHPYLRNKLSLYSTTDFRSYRFEEHLVEDDLLGDAEQSAYFTGFQQPSFVTRGGTMHFVSRTAYGTFDNYHDANMITYHRHSYR